MKSSVTCERVKEALARQPRIRFLPVSLNAERAEHYSIVRSQILTYVLYILLSLSRLTRLSCREL